MTEQLVVESKIHVAAQSVNYDDREEGELSDGGFEGGSPVKEENQQLKVWFLAVNDGGFGISGLKICCLKFQQLFQLKLYIWYHPFINLIDKILQKRKYKEDDDIVKNINGDDIEVGQEDDETSQQQINESKIKKKNAKKLKKIKKDLKLESEQHQATDSAEEIIKKHLKSKQTTIGQYQIKQEGADSEGSEYSSSRSRSESFSSQSITPQKQIGKKKQNQKNQAKNQQQQLQNQNKKNKNKNKKKNKQQQQKKLQDKFYTTRQGKRFKGQGNQFQQVQTPYLKGELCKFFLTNNCHRGNECSFSHNLKDFPCKYLHGTGYCEKGQGCKFNHNILNSEEIQKFIAENEDFLLELKQKNGKTNLGDYFENYLIQKEERDRQKLMQQSEQVMIPTSLMMNQNQNHLNNYGVNIPYVQGQGQQQLQQQQQSPAISMFNQIQGMIQNQDPSKSHNSHLQQQQFQIGTQQYQQHSQQIPQIQNPTQAIQTVISSLNLLQNQQQQQVAAPQQSNPLIQVLLQAIQQKQQVQQPINQNLNYQLNDPRLIGQQQIINNMQPLQQIGFNNQLPQQNISNSLNQATNQVLSNLLQTINPNASQVPSQIPTNSNPVLGQQSQSSNLLSALLNQQQTYQQQPQMLQSNIFPQPFAQPVQQQLQTQSQVQTFQQQIQRQEGSSFQNQPPYDPRKKEVAKKSKIARDLETIFNQLQKDKDHNNNKNISRRVYNQSKNELSNDEQSSSEDDEDEEEESKQEEEEEDLFFNGGKKMETEQAKQSLKDKLALSGIIRKNA